MFESHCIYAKLPCSYSVPSVPPSITDLGGIEASCGEGTGSYDQVGGRRVSNGAAPSVRKT